MLIFLAPPETEAEKETIWLGNTSSKLSAHGIWMAQEFATYDMWIKANRLYVAPAEHLLEYANIMLPSIVPVSVEEFTDRSLGTLTGRAYRETMKEFPRRNWLAWERNYWTAPPEGESLFDISDRVLSAFRSKVLPVEAREHVVIIAAPDVIRLILGFVLKTEEPEIPKLTVEPVIPYVINGEVK